MKTFTESGFYLCRDGTIIKAFPDTFCPEKFLRGDTSFTKHNIGELWSKNGVHNNASRSLDFVKYLGAENPLKEISEGGALACLLREAFDAGEAYFRNKQQPSFEKWLEKKVGYYDNI